MKKRGRSYKVLGPASVVFMLFIISQLFLASAQSNESVEAKLKIDEAGSCLQEMQMKDIPVVRAKDSLSEANQLYTAQLALEETKRKADYSIVLDYASEVCEIKSASIKAQDELKIFREVYNSAKAEINVSEMDVEYNNIERSFEEERFEETITLIDKGYSTLSEIQAKQTTTRLFLDTTKRTLKNFLIINWQKLISLRFYESAYFYVIIAILLIIIFWTAIARFRIRLKLYHLGMQKNALNGLIKKLQTDYFRNKNISETEYDIRLNRFKEMIRDIDRQIPLLMEQAVKINKNIIIPRGKIVGQMKPQEGNQEYNRLMSQRTKSSRKKRR